MRYIKNFMSMRKLNRILDLECDYYLYKIDSFDDRFNKSFFRQLIIYAREDICELYAQIDTKNFEIDKNGVFMSPNGLKKMLMSYCFYNTLCFSKRADVSEADVGQEEIDILSSYDCLSENLFSIFAVNEVERDKCNYFKDIIDVYSTGFELEFCKYMLEAIFGVEGNDTIFLAFIGNFFYNSYQGFIDSLTNYATLIDYQMSI